MRCGTGLACLAGEVKTDGGKGLAEGRAGGLDGGVQSPGPPPHPQTLEDAEHLKLLSIFHYVMAGLIALGGCLMMAYFAFSAYFFSEMIRAMPPGKGTPPPPAGIAWFFGAFGAVMCLGSWIVAALNFLSARWLAARKNRIFCFVVAALNCAAFPLGTALGVFTILVLQRPGVRAEFERHGAGGYMNR